MNHQGETPPTRVVHVYKNRSEVYIGRTMVNVGEAYVNRGWGNPFRPPNAIARYRAWLANQPKLLTRLGELRGKTLGCWCAPAGGLPGNLHGRTCHGEVLAALADMTPEQRQAWLIMERFNAREQIEEGHG